MEIKLNHIHKRFGHIHANNDICLTFRAGKITGILGENGAGKSTLMKILSGYQPADSGEVWLDGKLVDYTGPRAAIENGIGMLQQDPLDIGAFTVLENYVYGQRGSLNINRQQAENRFREICASLGFELDPEIPINQLSIARRQQLEIIRLLALGVKTLILDEPTTGISAEQKEILFSTLQQLAREQGMTVLLVSHKLEDVIALCDEVVVLRAGELIGQLDMPATKAELVTMMFGEVLGAPPRVSRNLNESPVILDLQNLSIERGRISVHNLDLTIRAGEIIGLAGLEGSGQQLVMRASAGLLPVRDGHVFLNGSDMTGKSYRAMLQAGVVYGAAGRLEEGLIAGLTLTEHQALISEKQSMINWRRAHELIDRQIKHYNVRGRPQDMIEQLSGGNQQRVLIALLPETPTLMVLEEPTRGLDVDSARWIWEQLMDRCSRGCSLIFSSADLDELVSYSDRILVFYAGRTYMVDDPESITIGKLGHLIGGEFEETSQ